MMLRIRKELETPVFLSTDVNNGIVNCTYWPTEGDGAEVTETITITLEGTAALVLATVQTIRNLLNEAALDSESIGQPVYLEFLAPTASTFYRSKILTSGMDWDGEPIRHKLDNATNTVSVNVTITRVNFWEGTETEIPLSTQAQSEASGGRTVYNNDNATANNNYCQIAANRVTGDLPAPVKLRIVQATAGSIGWRSFYVGNNAFSAPASADVWLLGSESLGGATYSWGAGGIGHNSLMFIFNLSSALLSQTRGRTFRILAAFTSATAGMYWRAGIYSNYQNFFLPVRVGRERYNSDAAGAIANKLMDLGALPIPPGGYDVAPGGAALVISARCAVAGSVTLDFVNLMACQVTDEFNSFLSFEQLGYSVDQNERVDIDGIDNTGGGYYSGGTKVAGSVKMHTDYLYVWPGKQQRIHVLYDEGATFTPGRQMNVSIFYRPRVRTIGA